MLVKSLKPLNWWVKDDDYTNMVLINGNAVGYANIKEKV